MRNIVSIPVYIEVDEWVCDGCGSKALPTKVLGANRLSHDDTLRASGTTYPLGWRWVGEYITCPSCRVEIVPHEPTT